MVFSWTSCKVLSVVSTAEVCFVIIFLFYWRQAQSRFLSFAFIYLLAVTAVLAGGRDLCGGGNRRGREPDSDGAVRQAQDPAAVGEDQGHDRQEHDQHLPAGGVAGVLERQRGQHSQDHARERDPVPGV